MRHAGAQRAREGECLGASGVKARVLRELARRSGRNWAETSACVRQAACGARTQGRGRGGVSWGQRHRILSGDVVGRNCRLGAWRSALSRVTRSTAQNGFWAMYVFNMKTHKAMVSVEESSVARKRVWTYERRPSGGTSAATRPLHAHRCEAMEQIWPQKTPPHSPSPCASSY